MLRSALAGPAGGRGCEMTWRRRCAQEDPRWEVLLLTCRSPEGHEAVAGFCTVYRFYAFPDRERLRLSQIVVRARLPRPPRSVGARQIKRNHHPDAREIRGLSLIFRCPHCAAALFFIMV